MNKTRKCGSRTIQGGEGNQCAWLVKGFPRSLKNQFIGLAKAQGNTGRGLLEYVVAKHIRSEAAELSADR